jgi:iron complex outermembrane receptor protein
MNKSLWFASAGLVALTAAPAFAQDAGQKDPTTQNSATAKSGAVAATDTAQTPIDTGDIIVTATRRNEALSNVPLAVSAVTAETLRNSGASDIRGLTQVSPSLLVSSTSSEAGAGVARIRGVGTVGDNPGLESSVALFIDGVYRSRTGVGLTELGPVDRIEVLRGPQGTLFGRNASAGLISIITAKPKFATEASGELTVGNYNLRRGVLSLNGALTDTIAARVDGVYVKRDGFLRDVISGRDVNNRDRYLIRSQLLFQPSTDLSFRIIGDYSNRKEECCAAAYLPAHDTVNTGGVISTQPSTIAALERGLGGIIEDNTFARLVSITPGRDYASKVRDYGLSGELNYKLGGGAQLTSITAYRYNNFLRGQDADFNNLDLLYRASDGGAFNRFKTFTQELRFQGTTFGDRLDYLVGGYYANEKLTVSDNLRYGADYGRYANCLLVASIRNVQQPTPTGNCINSTVLNGTLAGARASLAAVNSGITAVNAGIAALSAIPVGSRTPAQSAQLAALQAQLVTLLGQQAALIPAVGKLGAIDFNPANPGFGSIATLLGQPNFNFNGVGALDRFNQSSQNYAIFTHNIFAITDTLKATIGLRYTHERKRLNVNLTDNNTLCRAITGSPLQGFATLPCVIPSVPGGVFNATETKSESRVSGTGVLSWKMTPETLVYASYSRGYKAGGFNLDRSALTRTVASGAVAGVNSLASLRDLEFEPETNNSIEFGLKYNGHGIDINIAAFREEFKNFQLNTFNGINFQVENVNSCSSDLGGADTDNNPYSGACTGKLKPGVTSTGLETEVFTHPARDVTLNLGATYVVTKYARNLVGEFGRPLSNTLFQLPNRQLSNANEFTGTMSAGWTPAIGNSGLRALFYVDARHMSQFNTGSDLDLEKVQRGFNTVNGRIGIRGPRDMWSVELWGQNLFNKNYYQVGFDAPLQGSCTIRGAQANFCAATNPSNRATQLYGAFLAEPRTYGLTLRAKFTPAPRSVPDYVAPPVPPAPATQTCADGSVIALDAACPVMAPPPPPPAPAPSKGERG